MQSAPPQRGVDPRVVDEARAPRRASASPCSRDQRQHAPALRPVAVDLRRSSGAAARAARARAPAPARASPGCGARRTRRRLRVDIRLDLSVRVDARVLALEHRHLAAHALRAQPRGVQPREAERPLRDARAGPLDPPADPAAGAPEVVAPVRARPQLVPVDHQPEAAHAPQRRRPRAGRSRGTRRCGRRRSAARAAPGARARRARTRAAARSAAGPSACRAPAAARPRPRARPARPDPRRAATGAASGT